MAIRVSAARAAHDDASRHARLEEATLFLLRRRPEVSAVPVLTGRQRVSLAGGLCCVGAALVAAPGAAWLAISVVTAVVLAAAACWLLLLTVIGLVVDFPATDRRAAADDESLPTYTILVPLYREASVIEGLVAAIQALDYPPEKLDVKLLLEEDDDETATALESIPLAPMFEILVVPEGQPKTKPKACNYGLLQSRSDYVVIYDAEDRPERDQLRAAVAAFRSSPEEVVCVQAKLQYWNAEQNLITRWFTAEYAHRYGLYLGALERLGGPIPLGGTSNHFPTRVLLELGCWDPFNVTEDADLGVRLARAGYHTRVLDSTTYEEASSRTGTWLRQRSRWVKGHIQTWLVHMRRPLALRRELGTRRWFQFHLALAGTFLPLLAFLPVLVLTGLVAVSEAWSGAPWDPGLEHVLLATTFVGTSLLYVGLHAVALLRSGYPRLLGAAVLLPAYLLLMSIGAWRGLIQLVTRPSYWEKTTHGLAVPATELPGQDRIGAADPAAEQ